MCFRILIERDVKKTVRIKDERKKTEEPKPEEPAAPALTDVYYDASNGKFYSKLGPPTGIKLQSMNETDIFGQPIVREESQDKKEKKDKKGKEREHQKDKKNKKDRKEETSSPKKCYYKEMMSESPVNCCSHKSHRSGCKRQVLFIEPPKVVTYPHIDYSGTTAHGFEEVNLKTMKKPEGRGYETKELAMKAAFKQGLIMNDPTRAVQIMSGTQGGYFVVGVTDQY
ncbi:hypothetical protein TWF506_010872 [Arthrobotrys conoides]|uniref:Uncharacterized protein n=1 Tax=Arthrobotrys conoides TaxID=74498 RepID=A0AAN8NFJ9_9PEZI